MSGTRFFTGLTTDEMNSRSDGTLIQKMGIIIEDVAEGRLIASMSVRPDHMAPNGFLHAASVVALADSACGFATVAHLPEGADTFATVELKSNHLGTARDGDLDCVAMAQHMGRGTHVWDASVTHRQSGKTIALFRCTQMILWPRA